MEKLFYNPLVDREKPFCIVQMGRLHKGKRNVYTRDELKKLGKVYDQAAHQTILTMVPVIICDNLVW